MKPVGPGVEVNAPVVQSHCQDVALAGRRLRGSKSGNAILELERLAVRFPVGCAPANDKFVPAAREKVLTIPAPAARPDDALVGQRLFV